MRRLLWISWACLAAISISVLAANLAANATLRNGDTRGAWLRKAGPVAVWESPVEQKVRRDTPPPSSAPTETSVSIAAARGETEPFQIVLVPQQDDSLTSASVSTMRGPAGAVLHASLFMFREVAYLKITDPTDESSYSGWVPDPLPRLGFPLRLKAGSQQPIWVSVRVPTDAIAGDYAGVLRLAFSSGLRASLLLKLHVWDFALQAQRHIRTAYGMDLEQIDRYHHLHGNKAKRREVLRLYLRDFADHRVSTYDPFGDDGYVVTFPNWNWLDGIVVPDPAAPQSGNRVLEVNDNSTNTAVSAHTDIVMPVRQGVNYRVSWKVRTDGAHDYLVSVNQYDASDNWVWGLNYDIQRNGTGAWQNCSAIMPASAVDPTATQVRIFLYARSWTDQGELTGRTWFDSVRLAEVGSTQNLVTNGNFQLTPDQIKINVDFSRFDAAAAYALDELGADSFRLSLPYFADGHYTSSILGAPWGTPDYEAAFGRMLRLITDHLAARNWLDRAYTYWFDEPKRRDYPFVAKGMDMIRRADPRVQRLLTEQDEPELEGRLDIWCPIFDRYGRGWAKQRQSLGEKVWWYVCCAPLSPYPNNFIDHPAIEHRIRFWMAWQYKVQGDLYWDTTYWTDDSIFPAPKFQDPWTDPKSYFYSGGQQGSFGNGDGRLIYPPRDWRDGKTRIEGPTPSIRWELIREGIEDFEYFWMLKDAADRLDQQQKAPELAKHARALVNIPRTILSSRTKYTSNPAPMRARRMEAARTLELALKQLKASD